MGDPGGIGPRLIARAVSQLRERGRFAMFIFGDAEALRDAAILEGIDLPLTEIGFDDFMHGNPQRWQPGTALLVEVPQSAGGGFARGRVSARNGQAALAWIEAGVKACLGGVADALVTAPISKEAIHAAGAPFPGHTEYLASLCGVEEVRMMLVGGGLRVVLETIHVALAEVPRLLTPDHVRRSLEMIAQWSEEFLGKRARIAVCGLNPHAGENGQFGREEIEIIAPAIQAARALGVEASGPWPADTIFYRARRGEFDFVLAMYHDQGLVALKTVAFETGVNVTVGLPFIRTSPDHGTAFDRAWDPASEISSRSFEKAIELALRWSRRR